MKIVALLLAAQETSETMAPKAPKSIVRSEIWTGMDIINLIGIYRLGKDAAHSYANFLSHTHLQIRKHAHSLNIGVAEPKIDEP